MVGITAIATQNASANELSGTYQVQTSCVAYLKRGDHIVISGTETTFSYGIGYAEGVSPQLTIDQTGTYIISGSGPMSYGLKVKYDSAYLSDGEAFSFTQTILAGPNQPNDEVIRSVRVTKVGSSIYLQDSSLNSLGTPCVLVP